MAVSLDVIQLTVADMAESLRFYRLLGMHIPEGVEDEQHVEVTLPNGMRFAWDTVALMRQIHANWESPSGHRITLAFKCDDPAGVDALHHHLTGSGYQSLTAPWDAFWGQRYAVILDPDGNHVDLFAPL